MNFENKLYQLVYEAAQNITQANGYETDLGSYLRAWKGAVMPKDEDIIFEIRDVAGDTGDEQEPLQHEKISYEFLVIAKLGENTAEFLRKARADIYRMIGGNIDDWRAQLDASLDITRSGFEREIRYEEKIIGELSQKINFAYEQGYFEIKDY